jgi:hypothetical protein
MTKRTVIAGCILVLGAASGRLAMASHDPKFAKLPKEIQNIHCMDGDWHGPGKLDAGEVKAEVKVSISCHATSDGYGVSCQAKFAGMPGGDGAETDLFGYDPGQNKYHWFAVTSMGDTHDHVADVTKGNTIDWLYRGQQDGKPFEERVKFAFSEDGKRLEFRSDSTLGGAPAGTLSGTLTKK